MKVHMLGDESQRVVVLETPPFIRLHHLEAERHHGKSAIDKPRSQSSHCVYSARPLHRVLHRLRYEVIELVSAAVVGASTNDFAERNYEKRRYLRRQMRRHGTNSTPHLHTERIINGCLGYRVR